MTHGELVQKARVWLGRTWRSAAPEGHGACSVVLAELNCVSDTGEVPDAIGWSWGYSTLVECKVSRSDFAADMKKPFRMAEELGMGTQRYYLAQIGRAHV